MNIKDKPVNPFFTANKSGYGDTIVFKDEFLSFTPGITLLQEFSIRAMQAIISRTPYPYSVEMVAEQAIQYAKALILKLEDECKG